MGSEKRGEGGDEGCRRSVRNALDDDDDEEEAPGRVLLDRDAPLGIGVRAPHRVRSDEANEDVWRWVGFGRGGCGATLSRRTAACLFCLPRGVWIDGSPS